MRLPKLNHKGNRVYFPGTPEMSSLSQVMKSTLLLLLLSLAGSITHAQEHIDSLLYDQNGFAVRNKAFANYLRIALYPSDTLLRKAFKDFYTTGELRREGYFLSIDSLDDSQSRFDGKNTTYYRNGHIHEQLSYSNGVLDGGYLLYDETGELREEHFYVAGKETGIRRIHYDDGSCRIDEYNAGKPVYDYYLLADNRGNTLKFHREDETPFWESPSPEERAVDYRDGIPWQFYFKNGVTVALTNSVVRDYGKWHRIDLSITNNSLTPIEFTPEESIVAYSLDETEPTDSVSSLKVWSCDEYLKKVNRQQTWAAVLLGVSEGLASAGAGYSTSYTTGYSSTDGYASYSTTTYNPSAAYQANMASAARVANFGQAMEEEQNVKRMGYLKRNTIYPGETVTGFVHVEWLRGTRVFFIVTIEDAEYLFEWNFDRKTAFPAE